MTRFAHAHYVAVAEVVAALIRSGAIRAMNRLPVYAFAALLLAVVGILIVPLPPWLLDVLLAVNVFGSALVLLLSVTVEEPLQFSAFAPALLVATLFRLSLDVSATRLILTQGATPGAVGSIIPAFGAFVVNGNLVVGADRLCDSRHDSVRRHRQRFAARRRSGGAFHA